MRTETDAPDVLSNPAVVVEVLSQSTEFYDRGQKWEAYQRLPSLTDHLLVSQHAIRVEHCQRDRDGSWRFRVLEGGGTITLKDGATLSVDAIYEGAFETWPRVESPDEPFPGQSSERVARALAPHRD